MKTNKTKIKYLIYARKSSESDEKQVQSIDDQINIAKEIARDYKLDIVDTIFEAKSAKEPNNRNGFMELMSRIKEGEADGIICWKIDRLSRNPIDSSIVQWLLQQEKIKSIMTPGREYISDDNVLIFSVESSMANQYITDLSKNVKRGLKSKIEKGWRPGLAPIGWLNTKTEERGKNYLIKDEDRFPILRKCWELLLTGNYTPSEILYKLNKEWGFTTRISKTKGGKPMPRSTIYKMFNNIFYAGFIETPDGLKNGKHDPMVSVEEFDKAQIILGKDGRPRPGRHKYAYTGLIKCGECDGTISATHKEKILSTGEIGKYNLYYCSNARNKRAECGQTNYINSNIIEDQIKSKLNEFKILPDFKDWALEILSERNENDIENRQIIYKTQQKARNDLGRQLDNLTQALIKELVDEETYRKEKTRLKYEISILDTRIKESDKSQDNFIEMTEGVFNFACHASEEFNNGDTEVRKTIFSKIGVNWTLKDKKLSVSKHPWLLAIEKQYPGIESKYMLCELGNNPSNKRKKEVFNLLRPDLRERRDSNSQPSA